MRRRRKVLLRLQHLPCLKLVQRLVHLGQLAAGPTLDAVAPAGRHVGRGAAAAEISTRLGWRPETNCRQGSALACPTEPHCLACPRLARPLQYLHARLSVVGQMPSRLAASFSPTPNWLCKSSRVSRTPGLPVRGREKGRGLKRAPGELQLQAQVLGELENRPAQRGLTRVAHALPPMLAAALAAAAAGLVASTAAALIFAHRIVVIIVCRPMVKYMQLAGCDMKRATVQAAALQPRPTLPPCIVLALPARTCRPVAAIGAAAGAATALRGRHAAESATISRRRVTATPVGRVILAGVALRRRRQHAHLWRQHEGGCSCGGGGVPMYCVHFTRVQLTLLR